ncbi:MAG: amino acid adenylation domain-containing protein, partial [Cyanobacteria bacterium J06629_2]
TLLLTAFKVLLYRYSQQSDIVVGTDIANRDRTETEGLIGLLVNTLVLRTDLIGNPSFIEVLDRVKQVTLEAFSHQDLSFEKLVEILNPERNISQMVPLFQVKFDLQLAEVKPLELPDLEVERLPLEESTIKYELRFNLQNSESGINGYVEYSTDLFDESTIARMVEHFTVLLEGIVNNPQEQIAYLPLITTREQEQIDRVNNTFKTYPQYNSIVELFSIQANQTPNATAIIDCDLEITYQELEQQSDRLAGYLQSLGVKPEVRVGICVERSLDMIVGMLAILKAGGAYVPLDPNYPKERLDYIVEDSQIGILLTQSQHQDKFLDSNLTIIKLDSPSHQVPKPLSHQVTKHPNNLAYIIYTSGSTGKPKGVAIAHKNALQLLHWAEEVYTPKELSGVLAATSICFDLSVFEIFVPLSWGGTVILAENALDLPNLPNKDRVKLINTVPSAIASLLYTDSIPNSVTTINLAGESLKTELVSRLYEKEHIQNVYNLYGPSEDTTYSTYARVEGISRVSATIGKPVANTQVYVLDRHLQPVPIGISGELYLASEKTARGYLNRPELTAEKFIPNQTLLIKGIPPQSPLSKGGRGDRLYKTGDLVKYLPNGNLEFLGRSDRQTKIRGYRLEIDEVETAINSHPEVRESVVIAKQEDSLSQSLIAYIVKQTTNNSSTFPPLRQFLTLKLPSYAIPNVFIELDELLLLPNGKIDRRSLPEANNTHAESTASYTAPQTEVEKTIADIWQRELKLERVGINDNFFNLGGHSLLGIRIVAYISEALDKEVALKSLFQYPTIAELAQQIESIAIESTVSLPKIIPNPEAKYEPFPLTDIQQAYLIGRSSVFALGNVATHGYREFETVGLSIDAVESAWNKLIDRHEMLRMVATGDGKQQILKDVPKYKIKRIPFNQGEKEELQAIRDRLSHQIISLDSFPLFEIEAVELGEGRVRFCISFDVLIGDAWSFQLLAKEMVLLLLNPDTELPKFDLSFRDYILAEQKLRESELYRRSRDYWQQRIPNLPSAPELPLAKSLESITKPKFTRFSRTLSRELWQKLKQKALFAKITPSSLLLAAFSEVLTTWSRSPQFTINLTLFNRLPLHADVDKIIGDFTSSTLLEVDNRGQDSFINRCSKIQNQLWQDLDHRYVSGIEILRELARNRASNTGALMPVVFTSTLTQDNNEGNKSDRPWQAETVYSVSQTSQVYLDHQVGEIDGELVFNWDAIAELFPDGVLDDMFAAYCNLLEQLADGHSPVWNDSSRDLLPDYQKELFAEINSTELDLQGDNLQLQDLFFAKVAENPQQVAVINNDFSLTYQELSDRVNYLAEKLQQQLTDTENQIVAVVLNKGWEQVVATLGILTAGAAYVPIDPNLPSDRALHILSATNAQCIVTTEELANGIEWINENNCICIERNSVRANSRSPLRQSQNLAYIIYTSGSTGMPKGVAISHQGAVNTILDINRRFGIDESDRILALSSLSFDLSVYDIFGTLAAGGTIVIPDADANKDALEWRKLIERHQITVWNSVPALMEMLVESSRGERLFTLVDNNSLRLAMLSGDWIDLGLRDRIINNYPQAQVISLGGATEASIWSIFYPIENLDKSWKSIPYGRPLANQYFKILNNNLENCPLWVTGDLYIGGKGLADCYWQDREKTESSFLAPLNKGGLRGDRLYKTGDIGRYLPSGNIEFLGREDFQVKVNGYRIELGEIEATLQQHPQIDKALVTATGENTNKQLVAYLVPNQNNSYSPVDKIEFKLQQLGIRKIQDNEAEISLSIPEDDDTHLFLSRQSYRQFLPQEISLDNLSNFLSCLRQIQIDNSSLPKYRYGSAGSLYPVQTYVYLKDNCVTDIDAGYYYYHPQKHSLIAVSSNKDIDSNIYGVNQAIVEQANFSIFLVDTIYAYSG